MMQLTNFHSNVHHAISYWQYLA